MSHNVNDSSILDTLRKDTASWPLVSFSPTPDSGAAPESDTNLRTRYLVLLALHSLHHPTPVPQDEALVAYLLDQEIRYHQRADHYRSSISLACYLLARYGKPEYFWALWAARECNYDTTKLVDSHYLYYTTHGLDSAASYIAACDVRDVLAGAPAGGGRQQWWKDVQEEHEGRAEQAFDAVKSQIMERIAHDRTHGITDAKVEAFVAASWRSDTARWAESLHVDD